MSAMKTILVVDDSEVNRSILCKILSDEYHLLHAENGKQALEILNAEWQRISLVLLDIVMPVMDGYAFLKSVKSTPLLSEIPVIVTTQKDGDSDEVKALSSGAADFLTKPYKPQIIKHRVANMIHMHESAAMITRVEKDQLTGLLSKEFFYHNVQTALLQNPNKDYDLICGDIENFKLVNDMFGMSSGDALLCHFADILRSHTFGRGICGRLGPDTFAVLLERGVGYTNQTFELLNRELNQFPININLTMRFGVFTIDDQSVPINAMCDRALLAANSIKGHYGTFFAYYNDSIRQALLKKQFMLDHMETALVENQFVVYFQPKYNLQNNKIAGAEALVRWMHPQNGFMSPGEFIPLFEKNGFITKLDYYVWEKTCQQMCRWRDAGYPALPISVNVSRADIYNPGLIDTLIGLVEKYNLEPQQLHLEITETAYTENPKQIIEVASELKRFSFIIEMDDFGAGYSSLNMLSELPIDVLKLDMAFIQNESKKDGSKNILSFIVSLAKWMDLLVIAEGVETLEQVECLRNMECNYVQGYYFAKPMPAEDFEALLKLSEPGDEAVFFPKHTFNMDVSIVPNSAAKKSMVVVDDIELHRHILNQIFSPYYTIVEANNGAAAMAYIKSHAAQIEVILLDLVMPVLDGFQVLEELKKDALYYDIPIIITSQTGDSSEERALLLGADDFVAKPYSANVLLHHVRNVVAFARMKRLEKERQERLELSQEVYQDYLTGVLNRRGFDKAIERLDADENGFYALYMLDVDDLKYCNDTYGHAAGDALLRSFAEAVKAALRSDDIVARLGGDEFVILMKNMPSRAVALKKGQRLCRNSEWCCQEYPQQASCSIGVTVFQNSGDVKKFIEQADRALYTAKRNGKGQCCLFEAEPACAGILEGC